MIRFEGSRRVKAKCDICGEVTGPYIITLAGEDEDPAWIPKGRLRRWELTEGQAAYRDTSETDIIFGICPGCQFPKRHREGGE